MKLKVVFCLSTVIVALSCTAAPHNSKIMDRWVTGAMKLTGDDPGYPVTVVAAPLGDGKMVLTVTASVPGGNMVSLSLNPHDWTGGQLTAYRIGKQGLGFVLGAPGITEVYRVDTQNGMSGELWNPKSNAGDATAYVDWDKELVFAMNGNTDKGLPKNFEYTFSMYVNATHKVVAIDSSMNGPITFLRAEGTKVFYIKGSDTAAKELSFDYSGY